jgi:hypothetical protein
LRRLLASVLTCSILLAGCTRLPLAPSRIRLHADQRQPPRIWRRALPLLFLLLLLLLWLLGAPPMGVPARVGIADARRAVLCSKSAAAAIITCIRVLHRAPQRKVHCSKAMQERHGQAGSKEGTATAHGGRGQASRRRRQAPPSLSTPASQQMPPAAGALQ